MSTKIELIKNFFSKTDDMDRVRLFIITGLWILPASNFYHCFRTGALPYATPIGRMHEVYFSNNPSLFVFYFCLYALGVIFFAPPSIYAIIYRVWKKIKG